MSKRRHSKKSAGKSSGQTGKADAPEDQAVTPIDSGTREQLIGDLAKVDDPIDYEARRLKASKQLGVRLSVIDRAVSKKRRALGLDDDEGQGRAVKIDDPLIWHEPVSGDFIATTLACVVKLYLVLADAAANAIALWVLHTWLVDRFTMSPRLAITSATKGCGKTTLLRLLVHITRRGKKPAAFRRPHCFVRWKSFTRRSCSMKQKSM
jgi:putative DNA primase/helicase